MENEAPVAAASSSRKFAVPVGLLKLFKNDIRIFPIDPHPNGYITFDRDMLISILRSNDVEKQKELAKQIEIMGKAGGELVIMQ
jgi:hypothetical protein